MAPTRGSRRDAVAAFQKVAGDAGSLRGVGLLVLLRIVERTMFAGALLLARDRVLSAVVVVGITASVHAVRALTAVSLRIRIRVHAAQHVAAAVLASDPLQPLTARGIDAFPAILEGIEQGVRMVVDLVPGVLGDAVSTVIIAVVLAAVVRTGDVMVFAGAAMVSGALLMMLRRATARASRDAWQAQMPFWSQLRTITAARDELVANGVAKFAEDDLLTRLQAWAATERRYLVLAGLSRRLAWLAVLAVVLLGAWIQARGLADAEFLRRGFVLFGAAVPLVAFLGSIQEITGAQPAVATLTRLVTEPAGLPPPTHTLSSSTPLARPSSVVARGLAFRYPHTTTDAAQASFTWSAGRLLVVTGRNGAGKSTLLKLLLRFAEPSRGVLEIDGREASSLDATAWRRGIAYVSQTPYLDEDATVRGFLHLLAPGATDEAMRSALGRVGVWQRLERSTDALATPLRALSAGQKQRVVIARAIVQDRAVVLLDEPDASLDAEGVTELAALLRELARDRLVAAVAHSSMLVAAADDRVEMEASSS